MEETKDNKNFSEIENVFLMNRRQKKKKKL